MRAIDHPRFRPRAPVRTGGDKIAIAAPFWVLSFSCAFLKVYIENLCVDGITFHSMKQGCMGFVRQTTWFS